MRRGVWSNEAGIGTITNVSSLAEVDHPAQQGMSQTLGVLMDTIICTMTAFVVLSFSGFDAATEIAEESMPYLQMIFNLSLTDRSNLSPISCACMSASGCTGHSVP